MNYEFFFGVILFISLIGMGTIIWLKIPLLVGLPEVSSEKGESFGLKLKKKIKEFNPVRNFSYELFLKKLIFRMRILILKFDNQTFNWLRKLNERRKKKESENDDYWEKLKKIKKEK